MARAIAISLLCLAAAGRAYGQDAPRPLSLEEAISLAQEGNAGLRAVRSGVRASEKHRAASFGNYLPKIKTFANYLASNNTQGILLPAGSLGSFPELGGSFPPTDHTIPQGGNNLFFALTTVTQPLTHYFKISQGRGVLQADADVARAGLRRTEQAVALGVLKAYAGLLLAQRGRDVARERVAAAELRMGYQTVAVSSGAAVEAAARDAKVRWLKARNDLLEREGEIEDLSYALVDATGLPPGTQLKVSEPPAGDTTLAPLEEWINDAERYNPDRLEAEALVSKASHALGFARSAYIPEIGILGAHLFQNSIPFFPRNTFGVGIAGSLTLFDFGDRENSVSERRAQVQESRENLDMVEGRVRGQVEAAYRKLLRARDVVALAREALALRSEASRLETVQTDVGYGVPALQREATADRLEAEQDFLKAEMGERIARAELEQAAGVLGRPTSN
jgi:outer membrane protein TolC